MSWIFLAEILLFIIAIPAYLLIRRRKKARPDALNADPVQDTVDVERVKEVLNRLTQFTAGWDNEWERMDKTATAVLINFKGRVKESRDLENGIEGELGNLRGVQKKREENSQQEVAKSILGMVVRDKTSREVLSWAHGQAKGNPEKPPEGTSSRKPAPAMKPTQTTQARTARPEPGPKSGGMKPVRSWRPDKVFAS